MLPDPMIEYARNKPWSIQRPFYVLSALLSKSDYREGRASKRVLLDHTRLGHIAVYGDIQKLVALNFIGWQTGKATTSRSLEARIAACGSLLWVTTQFSGSTRTAVRIPPRIYTDLSARQRWQKLLDAYAQRRRQGSVTIRPKAVSRPQEGSTRPKDSSSCLSEIHSKKVVATDLVAINDFVGERFFAASDLRGDHLLQTKSRSKSKSKAKSNAKALVREIQWPSTRKVGQSAELHIELSP